VPPGTVLRPVSEDVDGNPRGDSPRGLSSLPSDDDGSPLPYYGYRVAESLVSVLPRRLAYGLACGLADTVRILRPHAADGLRANLGHVLPDAEPRQLRRLVRRNLRHLARSWVEVMAMRSDRERVKQGVEVAGFERYVEACRSGRGVAVISLHFGSWERGLAAGNAMGYPMGLLAERLRPARLFERVAGARGALGVDVIPIDTEAMRQSDPAVARRHGVAAIREIMRVLRSGQAIALAIDRDLIGNGQRFRFFDAEIPVPAGVVEVAMRAGAVILPVVLPRSRDGIAAEVYPAISYDLSAPRDQEVRRVVAETLRIFEDVIRRHPEQWHVMEPIFETPRP
jgi:lauroyl/myristoyl acyltransferase